MVKNLPANAGDTRNAGSIPGSGRSPGGGNGSPLQYSYLENPMDRGAGYSPWGHKTTRHNWATELMSRPRNKDKTKFRKLDPSFFGDQKGHQWLPWLGMWRMVREASYFSFHKHLLSTCCVPDRNSVIRIQQGNMNRPSFCPPGAQSWNKCL